MDGPMQEGGWVKGESWPLWNFVVLEHEPYHRATIPGHLISNPTTCALDHVNKKKKPSHTHA